MDSKIKLKEGEVLNFLLSRLKKSKSEVALDLNISDQTLSKAFASEVLTLNMKQRAAAYLGVSPSYFSGWYVADTADGDFDVVQEPEPVYVRGGSGSGPLTAAQVMNYLEEKDRRHYEERARLLGIIENLTKK